MSPTGISRKTRLGRLGAVGAAFACAAAFAAPAQAGVLDALDPGDLPLPGTEADSMHGNAPMLAWRGEYLRLTGCSDSVVANVPLLNQYLQANDLEVNDILDSSVEVTAWSGKHESTAPKVMPQKAQDWFLTADGQLCVKHVLMSTSDGLARVSQNLTLDVADIAGIIGDGPVVLPGSDEASSADVDDLISAILDLFSENERLLSRQALLGWMSLSTPQLSVADAPDANVPGGNGTELDVDVKGLMTMSGSDFSDYDFPDTVTLPDAWPDMAKQLAESTDPVIDKHAAQTYWDLHDDKESTEGHVGGAMACSGGSTQVDAVDNCAGGEAFSRVFAGLDSLLGVSNLLGVTPLGLTTDYTIGPFDPVRTAQTLLGDGKITPEDAPMPSTRIDFDILGNGVGHFGTGLLASDVGAADDPYLDPNASKREDYSRNGVGDASPHNLFAPYYTSLIPATGNGDFLFNTLPVSGVDGAVFGRNSAPGFLVAGPYDYWDVARILDAGDELPTQCLQWAGNGNVPRTTPEGANSIAVYTDEHGEARANWFPGMGYFFDQLPNLNQGCDLEDVESLGSSTVQAVASYPDEPVAPDKKSNTLAFDVGNLFSKYLVDYPKGSISHDGTIEDADGGDRNARVVIAHAQDIDGAGFANELVCLTSQGADDITFYGPSAGGLPVVDGYDLVGTSQSGPHNGPQKACGRTNDDGNVAFEVYRADANPNEQLGAVAQFVDEGLLRQTTLDYTDTDGNGNGNGGNGGNNGGGNNGGGNNGGGNPVVGGNGGVTPGTPVAPSGAKAAADSAGSNPPSATQVRANSIKVSSASRGTSTAKKYAVNGRLVRSRKGTAIRLKATGPNAKSVKVRVRLLNKKGKLVATRTFSVAPNTTVVVKTPVPASVKSISLSAI